jgi:hypothetical protein
MSPRTVFLSVLAAAVSLCLLGAGCGSPQERPLCQRPLAADPEDAEEEENDDDDARITFVRPIRPDEWLELLVSSEPGQRAVAECTGGQIAAAEPSEACREREQEAREAAREAGTEYVEEPAPEPVELGEESVHLGRISSLKKLVWVVTHEYENGDGLGPVALVEREDTDDGSFLKVRAIGTLRSRRERVRLRLESIPVRSLVSVLGERCPDEDEGNAAPPPPAPAGTPAAEDEEECEMGEFLLRSQGVNCRNANRPETCTFDRRYFRRMRDFLQCTNPEQPETCYILRQILIAEGETCEDPERLETCSRTAQFMFRTGDRFAQAELHDINGHCLGPAIMTFADRTKVTISGGWEREFVLATSFEIADAGNLLLHEQVVVTDRDPRQADVPPRPYRTADTDVRWYPFESRFVTATPSLWGRMLEEAASMHVPPAE